jgi:release factor glutamine methyltransferase
VDVIVANPPYVADNEELPPEVDRWEPPEALRAGPLGLEGVSDIVAEAPSWLAPSGVVVVEIAPHQADAARRLAAEAGLVVTAVEPDLTGRDRVLVARR